MSIKYLPLVQIKGPDNINREWNLRKYPRFRGNYVLMNGMGKNYLFSAFLVGESPTDYRDLERYFLNSAEKKGIAKPNSIFRLSDNGFITLSNEESILKSRSIIIDRGLENISKDLLKKHLFDKYDMVRYF